MHRAVKQVLNLGSDIRYAAVYHNGELSSGQKSSPENASALESDKYEELIVNPTLLKLVQQRGDIDCGGAQFVVIRYGNFFELVRPIKDGHISVGVELSANPLEIERKIFALLNENSLL